MLDMMKAQDGDIVRIPLTENKYAFAQIFGQGNFLAFFDYCGEISASSEMCLAYPILFKERSEINVIRGRRWEVVGHAGLSEQVLESFQLCEPYIPLEEDGLWRLVTYKCSLHGVQYHSNASTKELCKGVRKAESAFWLIEDELRACLLDLKPRGFTEGVQQFLLSLVPGIPAVIGEFGSLNNDEAYDWLKYELETTPSLAALEQALQRVYNSDRIISLAEGRVMLAASEIVLALLGNGRKGVETFAGQWLDQVRGRKLHLGQRARVLLPEAIRAIDCVLCDGSALLDSMKGRDGKPQPEWVSGVLDLKDQLEQLHYSEEG